MRSLLNDPIILICSGIILVGIFALVWAIKKFLAAAPAEIPDALSDFVSAPPNLGTIDFRAPAITTPSPAFGGTSPSVNKDVAARLDSMTQRLSEMQSVLMKQSTGAVAPGAPASSAGGVGQGFSPETIDKLLKIIGNVIQQVDILQKSMNGPKG